MAITWTDRHEAHMEELDTSEPAGTMRYLLGRLDALENRLFDVCEILPLIDVLPESWEDAEEKLATIAEMLKWDQEDVKRVTDQPLVASLQKREHELSRRIYGDD